MSNSSDDWDRARKLIHRREVSTLKLQCGTTIEVTEGHDQACAIVRVDDKELHLTYDEWEAFNQLKYHVTVKPPTRTEQAVKSLVEDEK
jgi:hypothetical protein